ncbi:metallophosphoesterase [Candidatus Bipolaricaulota bacterium]|nr:metallophosphoesterase [Candidatus Bipolaricaulota bacterium]
MLNRNRLLPSVAVWLAVLCMAGAMLAVSAPVHMGIITDVHAHDTDSPVEGKVMTNYEERLAAFVGAMNDMEIDIVIELGDLVNGTFVMGAEAGDEARIPAILASVETILAGLKAPRHYVLGNHDVYSLYKAEFLDIVATESTSLSYDIGDFHVVILDAQFNAAEEDLGHAFWVVPGTIPQAEIAWLQQDLEATDKPTIVCIHQPLDVDFALLAGGPEVRNHLEVRAVLEASENVIAVFQGHTHDFSHSEIGGIHYITFAAMVDHVEPTPPTWAVVTLDPETRTIVIDGEGAQPDASFTF